MKKKIIIGIIIILVLLFLLVIFINDKRKLTVIESISKDTLTVVNKIIDIPINFVNDKINEVKIKNDIYKKYDKLKKKVNDYELLEQKYNETAKELNDIKNNLNIKDNLIDYEIIDAYVISRNVGYWYDTLIINKGKNDSIKEGMAVINSRGLVGIITKTTYTTSTVKLLTGINNKNRISVKIKVNDDYLYGILSDYDNGYFIIEGISDNREIPVNSVVTTTGLDNKFASGIEVGTVSKTVSDNFDIARKVYIKSIVNFGDINYVMVLKR